MPIERWRGTARLRAWGRPCFALGVWFAGAAVLAGCPGTLDDPQRFLVDAGPDEAGSAAADPGGAANGGGCGDVVSRIFVPSCGGSSCHGASAPQQGLDLVSPGVAARVVGVASKACLATLADPKNPQSSLLYSKLSPTPSCGSAMPLARPPLSDADTACVLAWIAAQ